MSFTTIIFDFDGVMSEYNARVRLTEISRLTGLHTDTIYRRIWASGFENDADSGKYDDAGSYLDAFSAQLGYEFSRDNWIACRAAAMQPNTDMHRLVVGLKNRYQLAMLTNNGPLTKTAFRRLAPATADIFGSNLFFSYEFGTKKPDRRIYRHVAAALGSKPEHCLFIDDKQRNCDGATRSGMTAIVFENFTDLQDRLRRLNVARGAI